MDSSLGYDNAEEQEEANSLVYLNFGAETSYLAIGGSSGKIVIVDLSTMEPCFQEAEFIASEIIFLQHRKS